MNARTAKLLRNSSELDKHSAGQRHFFEKNFRQDGLAALAFIICGVVVIVLLVYRVLPVWLGAGLWVAMFGAMAVYGRRSWKKFEKHSKKENDILDGFESFLDEAKTEYAERRKAAKTPTGPSKRYLN